MIIIPAIDLKDGKCVRLRKGVMESADIFNDDPVRQARSWLDAGAARIHIVDLNGSVEGRPENLDVIRRMVEAVSVPVQLGGGIRTADTIHRYLEIGVQTVIIGTVAAREPDTVLEWLGRFPGRIAIGIDARNGMVAVQGWTDTTTLSATDLADRLASGKPAAYIYTDIDRDGMMQGPNIPATRSFAERTGVPVVLSGGVTTMDDLREIAPLESVGVTGIIVGRALYEGSIDLRSAIQLVERKDAR